MYVDESLQQDDVRESFVFHKHPMFIGEIFPLTGTQINVGTHEPDLRGFFFKKRIEREDQRSYGARETACFARDVL